MFIGPEAEGNLFGLQRDFYQKYGEHKELSQHVSEVMHTTFLIAPTSFIVSKLPKGEDGEVIEPKVILMSQDPVYKPT